MEEQKPRLEPGEGERVALVDEPVAASQPKPLETGPEKENPQERALHLINEANDLFKLNDALLLLKGASEKDTELFKDSIYCSNMIPSMLKGTVHSEMSFRYIDNQEIRAKLEELQTAYRIGHAQNMSELKSIATDVGRVKNQTAKQICEDIDKAVSLNGTAFAEPIIEALTNKLGLRDAVRRILKTMPKAQFKPEPIEPPKGHVDSEDPEEDFARSGRDAPTKTDPNPPKNSVKTPWTWRRLFGMRE